MFLAVWKGAGVLTYRFVLIFNGINYWDDDQMDRLAEAVPDIQWGMIAGEVRAYVQQTGSSPVDAVVRAVWAVKDAAPNASAVRVQHDLVAVADIAARAGVTREAARLWTVGKRGPGEFPRPLETVGDRIRIWDWAHVNAWLQTHYSLGEETHPLTIEDVVEANHQLAKMDDRKLVALFTTSFPSPIAMEWVRDEFTAAPPLPADALVS